MYFFRFQRSTCIPGTSYPERNFEFVLSENGQLPGRGHMV